MGLEDTARLMQIRISDLRLAVLSGKMINGKLPPKIHSVSGGGHLFFFFFVISKFLFKVKQFDSEEPKAGPSFLKE